MAAIIDQTRPDQTRPDQNYALNKDNLSSVYSDDFYELNRSDTNYVSACKVLGMLKKYFPFDSVIDIGCGVGQMLRACSDMGVTTIRGVDGFWVKDEQMLIPSGRFTRHDLSQPGIAGKVPEKHFDLTISSEVAEHIDPQYCDTFMDSLTLFSDVVLFSAAIPGQGGAHHVNEQYPSYWVEKFAARGFTAVDCIRPSIWFDESIRKDYRQNLFVLVRNDRMNDYPELGREAGKVIPDAAHYLYWEDKIQQLKDATDFSCMPFRAVLRHIGLGILYLVPSFMRAVKKRLLRKH